MATQRISRSKKSAAAALIQMGVPVREVAKELGMSKSMAHLAGQDLTLDPDVVKGCEKSFQGRSIVAADRFLSHALDNVNKLGPYQATLCAGIMSDHYLRHRMVGSRLNGGGSILVQVLVAIDQSSRSAESDPTLPVSSALPDVVIEGSQA